jgi:membrane protease YdiL (CAAX protease family)
LNKSLPTYSTDQHPLHKSILLHLLPGLLVTLAFLLLKPQLDPTGYPALLAFLLAALMIDVPLMLGVMLNEGKKLNGRYSLKGVVLYHDRLSWKTFSVVIVGAFIAVYLLIMLVTPISTYLKEGVFSWLPSWFFLDEQTQYEPYARGILIVVFLIQLVVTGIILPWVEELYFRGYLLPRLSRFGPWAPLLGGLLFGLYHLWQLYAFPTVFLLGVVLSYVVWWKKDVRLSISLHVVANVFGRLMFLMAALTM